MKRHFPIIKSYWPILLSFLFLTGSASGAGAQHADTIKKAVRQFIPHSNNNQNEMHCMMQDDRGIMYFGHEKGLLEFDAKYWEEVPYPHKSGIYSMAKNDSGRIFVGGKGEFGYLGAGYTGQMRYVSLSDSLADRFHISNDPVFKTVAYKGGAAFLSDHMIYLFHEETSTRISTSDHFYGAAALNSRLYVIDGRSGLALVEGGQLNPVSGGKHLRSFVLLPYPGKRLLIVGNSGTMYIFEPPRNTNVKQASAPSLTLLNQKDNPLRGYQVVSGDVINESYFALGTTRGGCFIVNASGKVVLHLDKSNGLPGNDIYDVYGDAKYQLWLATEGGISLIDLPAVIENLDADRKKSEPVFRASIRRCQSTLNDSVIFGGAFYRRLNGIPILQQLEHLYHVFSSKYNSFRFSYSAIDYKHADRLQFQTYMEGLDQDWSPWSERTFSEYRSMYWRKYRFHVRARNPEGDISKAAVYEFKIKPPWFESWWFYLGQVIFIFLLLVLAWSFKRLNKSEKFSEKLTNVAVIVMFKYIYIAIAPIIGIFSAGIAFFKILTSVALGFVIDPTKAFINTKLTDLIVKNNDITTETGETAESEDAGDYADMTDEMQ